MANWGTGKMIKTTAMPTGYTGVANAMAAPKGYSNYNYNFGSGIQMPQPSASSQAIASFANRPAATPQPQAVAQQPAGAGGTPGGYPIIPPPARTPPSQRFAAELYANQYGTQGAGPAVQPQNHADYVTKMNAMMDAARAGGLSEADANAYGQRLNYTGLNTYGGGDPAAGLAQWQDEQRRAKEAQIAQAAAGSTNWVSGG